VTLSTIPVALQALQQGKMIIVVDDEQRENEGDLVMAAEFVTAEAINFMSQQGRGLICMPMTADHFTRLQIPMMAQTNKSHQQTPFGVSFGAAAGISTGISARDRARTIQVAADPASEAADIVMPGHVFPLRASPHGVLSRDGHTEATVDLMRLAGLQPAGVICEIMNADGSMARLPQLVEFAQQHDLIIISIVDLIAYRMQFEMLVNELSTARLPVREFGLFTIKTFVSVVDGVEHVALIRPCVNSSNPPLVRLHSECLTGDVFGSLRCDCGEQLQRSLALIAEQGGIVLYLRQEGRGIGLANKIKAYALQDEGLDTVEANHRLGFAADARDYGYAAQILKLLGVSACRLITNNPAKMLGLHRYGLQVLERVALQSTPHAENRDYLTTKREKLGHLLDPAG